MGGCGISRAVRRPVSNLGRGGSSCRLPEATSLSIYGLKPETGMGENNIGMAMDQGGSQGEGRHTNFAEKIRSSMEEGSWVIAKPC